MAPRGASAIDSEGRTEVRTCGSRKSSISVPIELATIRRGQMKSFRSILALGAFFVLAAGAVGVRQRHRRKLGRRHGRQPDHARRRSTTGCTSRRRATRRRAPGAPVIVPNDPPDFKKCIAQVRKQIPTLAKTTDKQLKTDCNQLFTSLGSQVMDFLIKSYWYQAEAAPARDQGHRRRRSRRRSTPPRSSSSRPRAAFHDVPHPVRADDAGHPLPRPRQRDLQEAAREAPDDGHAGGDPDLLQEPTCRSSARRETRRHPDRADEHRGAGEGRQGRALAAARAGRSSPRSTRSTRRKNKGGLLTGVTKGEEEAALDTAAFVGGEGQGARPDPGLSSATTCSRSTKDQGLDAADARAGDAADQADPQGPDADLRADRGRQAGQEAAG